MLRNVAKITVCVCASHMSVQIPYVTHKWVINDTSTVKGNVAGFSSSHSCKPPNSLTLTCLSTCQAGVQVQP